MTHLYESDEKEFGMLKSGIQTFLVIKPPKTIKIEDTIIIQHSEETENDSHITELLLIVTFIANGETPGLKQGYCVIGIKEKGQIHESL